MAKRRVCRLTTNSPTMAVKVERANDGHPEAWRWQFEYTKLEDGGRGGKRWRVSEKQTAPYDSIFTWRVDETELPLACWRAQTLYVHGAWYGLNHISKQGPTYPNIQCLPRDMSMFWGLRTLECSSLNGTLVSSPSCMFPRTWPPTLTHVVLNRCQLTDLPDALLTLPLTTLDLTSNRLSSLPRLPHTLRELKLTSNRLVELPDTLPAALTTLDVSLNPLQALPDNFHTHTQLERLNLSLLPELSTLRVPSTLAKLDVSFCGRWRHMAPGSTLAPTAELIDRYVRWDMSDLHVCEFLRSREVAMDDTTTGSSSCFT